ncbi:hypothetical protein BSZ19_24860 [Bradyrhizobium japonicum]|uniref:Uncharacterized protein n=1 Tax=Bradyrhizobium japonicum TaxID=375 RepID=A0A1Y2JKA5_BRAJP|nr:hypothetical protein BSZ19_24860 [Bradyrhizobium japonicum]
MAQAGSDAPALSRQRAKAVANDLANGTPLCPNTTVVDGDYDGLADARLVMINAGANVRRGHRPERFRRPLASWTRMPGIYRDIVPRTV